MCLLLHSLHLSWLCHHVSHRREPVPPVLHVKALHALSYNLLASYSHFLYPSLLAFCYGNVPDRFFRVKGTGSVLFLHLFLHHPLETFISRLYMKRLTPDICWALALTQRVAVSIHLCAGLTPLPAHPSVFLVFWMLWESRAIHQCSGSWSQLSFHNITVSPLHLVRFTGSVLQQSWRSVIFCRSHKRKTCRFQICEIGTSSEERRRALTE